ncbi:MAG: hypothetical protein ACI4JQ_06160 [Ruminococcus sp.]
MAKFWCKVCNEPLRTMEGALVATCSVCGARQALPHAMNHKYLMHFGELSRMRQSGDFEGAQVLADALLKQSGKDAALYWQRTLIHYQAVYHQEQGKRTYVLTCAYQEHVPVSENEDFKKTLHFASAAQRGIYEEDGKLLEQARRILCGESYVPDESVLPLNSGFLCLEDGEWDAAMQRFDCVLAETPENALAYFGKMMAELHVRREGELSHMGYQLPETENYQYVLKYGDDILRQRLNHYWETGLLAHAVKECESAVTVDDWKQIKKLLQQIPENEQARENIILCDKKIREIMVRDAQVVIGCREAANLGLTTETLGARMVNANYYYDFDVPDAAQSAKRKRTEDLFRIAIIAALLGLVGVVLYILLAGDTQNMEEAAPDLSAIGTAETNTMQAESTEETQSASQSEESAYVPQLCMVGERVFTLQEDGTVQCLSGDELLQTDTTAVSGVSFSGNVNPYASDWWEWKDVAALYSDPTGAMLFGVMKNGTVAYDIFSASDMKYEETYRTISSWINVRSLVWDDSDPENICLFALTKDGRLYASDAEAEEMTLSILSPFFQQEQMVNAISARNGRLHILFENGSYFVIEYDVS